MNEKVVHNGMEYNVSLEIYRGGMTLKVNDILCEDALDCGNFLYIATIPESAGMLMVMIHRDHTYIYDITPETNIKKYALGIIGRTVPRWWKYFFFFTAMASIAFYVVYSDMLHGSLSWRQLPPGIVLLLWWTLDDRVFSSPKYPLRRRIIWRNITWIATVLFMIIYSVIVFRR